MLPVLVSIIIVSCSFDIYTMNWLDPFSVIYMDGASVTVTTIWQEAAVDSFLFARRC